MKKNVRSIGKILFLSISVAICASSCSSKTVPFATSTVVPGTEGTVKVKKDNNQNYLIDLDIDHLPPSESLTPPKKSYVAWMETKENGTKNIGQVTSSKGMLSKARKASLSTVSTFKPIRIYITAEENGSIEIPAGMVVLTTDSFAAK